MAWQDSFAPFVDSTANVASQWGWLLWVFVGIAAVIFIAVIIKITRDKKKQWTHKLHVRRVLPTGYLSGVATIKMRRFPLIRSAEVFELEKPLLGSYLIAELDSYTGNQEYSIIIDNNNRIYTNKGETFNPDSQSVNVSAKHSEIDLAMSDFKSKYQEVHKVPKRIEWAAVAKFAMIGLLIIAVMVVAIKGIEQWGGNHQADADKAIAEAETYRQLNEVLQTVEGTVNAQLILVEEIKELKGTNNIQGIVNEAKNQSA